jgi:hypothetical protein
MNILRIRFGHLRNEAHYEILVIFDSLLNKFTVVKALVSMFYTLFLQLLNREKQLVDAAKKSPLTEDLTEADKRIDRDLTAMRDAVKSAMNHFTPSVAKAGKELYERLKDFGNIREKSYEEESAAVQVLISDLQTKFAPQVAAVGLTQWLSELYNAEAAFTAIYLQRNAEDSAREQDNMKEVRKEIEAVYKKMIIIIENNMNTTGEATCGQFARELNEAIKYANEHIHRHVKTDIAEATVKTIDDQPYTSRPVIFIPEVWHNHRELVATVDYTFTFRNNIQPGNAELILRGIGDFKGKKTVTFTIASAGPAPLTESEPEEQ